MKNEKNIYQFLWECYDTIPAFAQLVYENIDLENQWADDEGGGEVEFETVADYFEGLVKNEGS